LIWIDPFQYTVAALTRGFGQDPTNTDTYTDASVQEISHGEHPERSFTWLAASYRDDARRRVDLIGNSQTYTVVLAPGEHIAASEKTYPDLLAEHYGKDVHLYRLSAPNISYTEVLWYMLYLESRAELTPDELIVQVNYETFRKTGIRAGMQELLDDAGFRQRISEIAAADPLYSGVFQQAISEYEQRRRASAQTGSSSASSNTGVTESNGWGEWLETQTRNWLGRTGIPARQARSKSELLLTLYLCRVHLLKLKPSTPRGLAPAALVINRDALREVVRICRLHRVRLRLMNAPQNPRAPLYRNDADRQQYRAVVDVVAKEFSIPVFDFEDRIPAEEWGSWVDGPDPIHFGLEGHRRMARLMIESGIIGGREQ
jgi:hypothetical protein